MSFTAYQSGERFETLGTYTPAGLRAHIREMDSSHPDYRVLAASNAKHRDEMAARLDLLKHIAKELENKPD